MNTLYAHLWTFNVNPDPFFFPKKKEMNQITDPAQIEIFLLTSATAIQCLF